jgi:hypothetical protein
MEIPHAKLLTFSFSVVSSQVPPVSGPGRSRVTWHIPAAMGNA